MGPTIQLFIRSLLEECHLFHNLQAADLTCLKSLPKSEYQKGKTSKLVWLYTCLHVFIFQYISQYVNNSIYEVLLSWWFQLLYTMWTHPDLCWLVRRRILTSLWICFIRLNTLKKFFNKKKFKIKSCDILLKLTWFT